MDEGLIHQLPATLEATVRDNNPWWRGESIGSLPVRRRWIFATTLRRVKQGLAPVTVLRGPRQVGKTTLLNQVISQLISEGVDPRRLFRIQFDDLPSLRKLTEPILELSRWYSSTILTRSLTQAVQEGPVYLLFDEIQNLPDWSTQLKHLVDINRGVRVLVTGSSALRIEEGRDSLAGRIHTLELGPLLLREIAEWREGMDMGPFWENGLGSFKELDFWQSLRTFGQEHTQLRQLAFSAFSERGAYPVAHSRTDTTWEQIAEFLNETVIRRAIQHDLRMGSRGKKRDEHLLEEVFRIACRYIGQSPAPAVYLQELQQAMHANLGPQRVASYLKFLDGTLLLRLIQPLELRLKKKKGQPKLCLCDHALRAAWLQEVVPLTVDGLALSPHMSDMAGRIAESVAGYFFRSIIDLEVAYFPERTTEPEVDFILTVGESRIPVEIKYRRRIDYGDTRGLRSFMEHSAYNAPFGILVTLNDDHSLNDPRILTMPLSTLLMMR